MPLSKVPFQLSCSPFRDWKELWGFPRAISSPGWTTLTLSACFHTKVLQPFQHFHGLLWTYSTCWHPYVRGPRAALQVASHRAELRGRIPSLGLLPRCIPERHLCPLGCQGTLLSTLLPLGLLSVDSKPSLYLCVGLPILHHVPTYGELEKKFA